MAPAWLKPGRINSYDRAAISGFKANHCAMMPMVSSRRYSERLVGLLRNKKTRESGYPEVLDFSGFQITLANFLIPTPGLTKEQLDDGAADFEDPHVPAVRK